MDAMNSDAVWEVCEKGGITYTRDECLLRTIV